MNCMHSYECGPDLARNFHHPSSKIHFLFVHTSLCNHEVVWHVLREVSCILGQLNHLRKSCAAKCWDFKVLILELVKLVGAALLGFGVYAQALHGSTTLINHGIVALPIGLMVLGGFVLAVAYGSIPLLHYFFYLMMPFFSKKLLRLLRSALGKSFPPGACMWNLSHYSYWSIFVDTLFQNSTFSLCFCWLALKSVLALLLTSTSMYFLLFLFFGLDFNIFLRADIPNQLHTAWMHADNYTQNITQYTVCYLLYISFLRYSLLLFSIC